MVTRVFQVFILDSKKMNEELHDKDEDGTNLPDSYRKLADQLIKKGYQILESFNMVSGLPTSLIVIGEIPSQRSLKTDFYELAKSLGLEWFLSGEAFLEALIDVPRVVHILSLDNNAPERKWVEEHAKELTQFVGNWIAIEGDRLVAHSPDYEEVIKRAREEGVSIPYVIKLPIQKF